MAQEGTSTAPVYTWKIMNFTKSTFNKLRSDVFMFAGYKWILVAYPEENPATVFLSLILEVANSCELPDGWSIDMVSIKLIVDVPSNMVDQFHTKDSKERSTKHRFHAGKPDCAFKYFLQIDCLKYIVPHTLVVRVYLSVSPEQTANVLMKSKNLLVEMSSMKRTLISTSSSGTSGSSLPLNPQSLQHHRKSLLYYLTLSLEAIVEANAFDDIERIAVILVQHSSNSLEKIILEDLVSRLATFKETIVSTKPNIENIKANKIALSGKSADVVARLDHDREQLCTLEANYSELSEEELRLKAEILRLTTQVEELCVRKSSIFLELQKMNGKVSKDLEEWRDIRKESVEEDKNWLQTREKLAQANLSWNLFRQNLEQFIKSE